MVKRYVTTCDCMSQAAWGDYVRYDDYATLEAENAKLRAELERLRPDGCLIVPIQPTEEMRKRAQDYLAAEGMIVSDWLIHTSYREMLAAIPSAPKADEYRCRKCGEKTPPPEPYKAYVLCDCGYMTSATAAIAAAQEGGKV